jgi:hypothetical protein
VPKVVMGTATHTAMMMGATCNEKNRAYWRPDSRTISTQWSGELGGGPGVKRRSTVCHWKSDRWSMDANTTYLTGQVEGAEL